VFLVALAALGLIYASSSGLAGDRAGARIVALGVVALPLGAIIAIVALRPHRGLRALSNPERIVWYYGVNRGAYSHAVVIGLDDGKLYRFPLPLISVREGFSQQAFELLRAAAPRATAGFSEAQRVAFRRAPESLRGG
jgi:hypothetical protein